MIEDQSSLLPLPRLEFVMPQSDASAAKAYWPAVVAISLAMFGLIGSELLPVGLLTPMAQDLNVAIGATGQAITATAIIAAIASPVIILGRSF